MATISSDWGLVLIDPQNDFVLPSGAFAIPDAETLCPVWTQLLTAARQANAAIIASVYVNPSVPESDHQGLPAHCIAGTSGVEIVQEAQLQGPVLHLSDAQAAAAVLQDLPNEITLERQGTDIWTNPLFERILDKFRLQGVSAWVVAGVATEQSVKQVVMGLRSHNLPAYLLADAIQGLSQESTVQALEEMQAAGASLIESATAIIHWRKTGAELSERAMGSTHIGG